MGPHAGSELTDPGRPGDRLLLRPGRPADVEHLAASTSAPSIRGFAAGTGPFGAGDTGRTDGPGSTSAVVERDSGRVIGLAGIADRQLRGDGEITLWIAPDVRGQGYGVEVLRVLADRAFAHGRHRIAIGCDVRDLATARTALAAGFQYEGISRDAVEGRASDGANASDGTAGLCSDWARFARLADDPGDLIRPRFAALPAGGLSDGVLTLRVTEPDDATGLFETDDETTLRWSFNGERHTMAQARRTAAQAGLVWLVGGVAQLTMTDNANGDYAGELHLRAAGPPQVGGLGYVVHPRFRGRGFTTRALRLVVPWAFDTGFARLELGAKTANVASQRAAISAGFEPDGVRRARLRAPDGTFDDETRYVLINPG